LKKAMMQSVSSNGAFPDRGSFESAGGPAHSTTLRGFQAPPFFHLRPEFLIFIGRGRQEMWAKEQEKGWQTSSSVALVCAQ
jgi:hypothetical protein